MKSIVRAALILAACAPLSWSQGTEKSSPKDAQEIKVRVKFDQDSAKGEITCRKGELKGDKIEFERCLKYNVEKYKDKAVEKHIVEADKVATLDEKEKALAAKLAFLDSAREEIKKEIREVESRRDSLDYKKAMGAKKKIDAELHESIEACRHDSKHVFKCPEWIDDSMMPKQAPRR
jgi:hypothetical protein